MRQYDFFDLTKLPFDPPETSPKKVKAALEKTVKGLRGLEGVASQDAERREIAEKLRFLEETEHALLDDRNAFRKEMAKLAEVRKGRAMRELADTADIQKVETPKPAITRRKLKTMGKEFRLSPESAERVYREKGFAIIDDPVVSPPDFPPNAERIAETLERFRETADPNPNGADRSRATDLYGFAAYLKGQPESGEEYRNWPTEDLRRLLHDGAVEYAQRSDPIGSLCKQISSFGETCAFCNEERRRAYDRFLLYQSLFAIPDLSKGLRALRNRPKSDRRAPETADRLIQGITKVFGDSRAALSIYNYVAGLLDDPYIPEKAAYYVRCSRCHTVFEFPSFDEATKGVCSQCGSKLFRTCAKCGRAVLSGSARCSECGFQFPNPGQFAEFIANAERFLREKNFEAARLELRKAIEADPAARDITDALERRIDNGESEYPPSPPSDLRAAVTGKEVVLTWKASGDWNVSYTLLRKEGGIAPKGPHDGVVLCADTKALSWNDADANGRFYSYAVFARRREVFSAPAAFSVQVMRPVAEALCQQKEDCIHITWNAPPNCYAVKVRRSVDGEEPVKLASVSGGYYDDRDMRSGKLHAYYLTAQYPGLGDSAEIRVDFRPTVIVPPFSITAERTEDSLSVSWSIKRDDVDLRILLDDVVTERVSSGAKSCRIVLPDGNGVHTLRVEAFSGGRWTPSVNVVPLNTLRPCPVGNAQVTERPMQMGDGAVTGWIECSFRIQGEIPADVSAFLFTVRTKARASDPAPYLTSEELAQAPDRRRVEIADYQRVGKLTYSALVNAEETFYLTLCALYRQGDREVCSVTPFRKKINRPLIAEIFWKVSVPWFGRPKLRIRIEANRPFTRRPELLLCVSRNGKTPTSPLSPEAEILLDLQEATLPAPETEYRHVFELKTDAVRRGRSVYLFLADAQERQYRLRWEEGFAGKA